MAFTVCVIAVFCLVSVSQSSPLPCEELVQPLVLLDPRHLEGRWALIAGSLKNTAAVDILKGRDSVTIDLYNSSYTQANYIGGTCQYHAHNFTLEGHIFTLKEKTFNFTGIFYHTSCQDCLVLTFDVESPDFKTMDFYLVSKRRELDEKEMEEFRAQAECLKMPPPIVMDPTKELCPEQTSSEPTHTGEKAEGEKA